MKVYVAGSFKNAVKIRLFAQRLREAGLHCYVFCDENERTNLLSEELRNKYDITLCKPNTALRVPIIYDIGQINLDMLKIYDAVIVVLPCGKSAHLEAGYMAGSGRPVWIYGPMVRGEFDAMYVMAKGVYDENEFDKLIADVRAYDTITDR